MNSLNFNLHTLHLIGGTTPETRNIIGGNPLGGIILGGARNRVWGNYIGVGVNGQTPLGNLGEGVRCRNGSENRVGGTGNGEANIIAYNNGAGVVNDAPGNDFSVRGNSIHSNTGLGLDLSGNGPDPLIPYAQSSGWHNAPIITLATTSQGGLTIKGRLNSIPNAATTIDFYLSPTCDFSGYGQGKTYLGTTTVKTNEVADTDFSLVLAELVMPGQILTATATRQGGWTIGIFDLCDGESRVYR